MIDLIIVLLVVGVVMALVPMDAEIKRILLVVVIVVVVVMLIELLFPWGGVVPIRR